MLEYIDKKDIDNANKNIKKLVLNILKRKRGGKSNKTIQKRTGKLERSLDAFLVIEKDSLFVNIDAINYYKYLDTGTDKIRKPWFLTKELTESKEFSTIIKELLTKQYINKILK